MAVQLRLARPLIMVNGSAPKPWDRWTRQPGWVVSTPVAARPGPSLDLRPGPGWAAHPCSELRWLPSLGAVTAAISGSAGQERTRRRRLGGGPCGGTAVLRAAIAAVVG